MGVQSLFFLSLAVWWAKLEKNDKVRYNNIMIQIASLLTVATVLYWLMDSIYQSGREGTYMRDKTTYAET